MREELKVVVGEVATLLLFMPILAVLVSCWLSLSLSLSLSLPPSPSLLLYDVST